MELLSGASHLPDYYKKGNMFRLWTDSLYVDNLVISGCVKILQDGIFPVAAGEMKHPGCSVLIPGGGLNIDALAILFPDDCLGL